MMKCIGSNDRDQFGCRPMTRTLNFSTKELINAEEKTISMGFVREEEIGVRMRKTLQECPKVTSRSCLALHTHPPLKECWRQWIVWSHQMHCRVGKKDIISDASI